MHTPLPGQTVYQVSILVLLDQICVNLDIRLKPHILNLENGNLPLLHFYLVLLALDLNLLLLK